MAVPQLFPAESKIEKIGKIPFSVPADLTLPPGMIEALPKIGGAFGHLRDLRGTSPDLRQGESVPIAAIEKCT